ncbi:MAG: EamA family transporter [Desulfurococcaceae archaeon]
MARLAGDWFVAAVLDAFFAALATIFAKIGLQGVDSLVATALRSVVMLGIAMAMAIALRGPQALGEVTRGQALYILLSGIAGGLSWILYFYALQKGPTSPVATIDKTSLLFIVVLSILVLGEKVTIKQAVAAALVVAALVLAAL